MEKQVITDVKATKSKKQRLIELEEIMSEEMIGLGGWLFFVQVGMVLQLLLCLLGIVYSDGDSLKIIAFAIPLVLASAALFSFYKLNENFRWLLIAATLVLALDGFLLVEPYNISFHYFWASVFLVVFIAACISLFFSKRFKATFCERGKQIVIERRKNLVGIGGWLSLFHVYLFLIFVELFILIVSLVATFIREDIPSIDASGVLHLVLIPIIMATIAVTLALFMKRRLVFRNVYIAVAALYFVFKLLMTQNHYLVLQILIGLILHGLMIFALFKSYRVKNTFK